MNFFKLYIGDYQRDTASLSLAEHGAYILMLQHFYATGKPLPTGAALHRMLRAQDKNEKKVIDFISEKFWLLTDDGLVNERAQQEIEKASAQAENNARIARRREADRRQSVRRTAHDESTNRATNDQPIHSQINPNTSPPVSPSAPEEAIPPGVDSTAWHRWVDYRSRIRKPLKRVSFLAAQRKLAAYGADQAAVVEQSIANGWQGLFALKTETGGPDGARERVDNSAVGKVRRANAERERRDAFRAPDGPAVAADGVDVRPPLDEQLRRGG